MFLINVLDYLIAFEFIYYVFGSFAFFGIMLCLRKLILHKGI